MGADASLGLDEVVALLAPALGEERARELTRGALNSLGITTSLLSAQDAIRALETLGQSPGVVGSATRFAKASLALRFTSRPSHMPAVSRPASQSSRGGPLTRADLVELLAPTLGMEKSEEVLLGTLQQLRLSVDQVSAEDGLAVLEELTKSPGIVGIASRFAKVHLLMRSAKV
jgi:hypothetical protein